ncbi:hypothetical protein [Clostridium cuniculi]|nr:hypothetical protein [Clostridium cuniculi]
MKTISRKLYKNDDRYLIDDEYFNSIEYIGVIAYIYNKEFMG